MRSLPLGLAVLALTACAPEPPDDGGDAEACPAVATEEAMHHLWSTRADGSCPWDATPALTGFLRHASLAPDGDRARFCSLHSCQEARLDGTDVRDVDPASSEPTQPETWQISPDWRWRARVERQGGSLRVSIAPLDGGEPASVDVATGQWLEVRRLSWAPDSRHFALDTGDPTGPLVLATDLTVVADYTRRFQYGAFGSWSPDGVRFDHTGTSGGDGDDHWILGGTDPSWSDTLDLPVADDPFSRSGAWGPDGEYVLPARVDHVQVIQAWPSYGGPPRTIWTGTDGGPQYAVVGVSVEGTVLLGRLDPFGIVTESLLLDRDGGNPRVVPVAFHEGAWSPDGQRFAGFGTEAGGSTLRVLVVDLDGAITPVTSLAPTWDVRFEGWTADSSRLVWRGPPPDSAF